MPMKLDILFENEQYVFVNKPSGILSIPDRHNADIPSVTGILRKMYPEIFIIHRIDRETSGCICFAKDAITHQFTSQLFEKRAVQKTYRGIVHGNVIPEHGMLEQAIMEHPTIKGKMMVHAKQGKACLTEYHVLEAFGLYSYVSFTLHTGRTHQIRVHCSDMGHPLVCDGLYGNAQPVYISAMKKKYNLSKISLEEQPIIQRIALHAYSLSFTDHAGNNLAVEAPVPKDMGAMLNQCRKWLSSSKK